MTKNYVGVDFDYQNDEVLVWERPLEGGARTLKRVKAPRYFYIPADDGTYTSIYGEKLARLDFGSLEEFDEAIKETDRLRIPRYESDIAPMFKTLMNDYYECPLPTLNFAFFDIELDVDMEIGWATVENPYAPINAVSIYQSWTDQIKTYVVAPKGYKGDFDFQAEADRLGYTAKLNIVVCSSELQLLTFLIEDIQDSDVLSGWNSEFFDVPYTIRRLERVAPKLLHKMSFIGARKPKAGAVEKFGEQRVVYKLFGRTHLDYMDLFKKFAQDVKYESYSLGFVGEKEVGVSKVHFDGTFQEFYNNEFKKFTIYNARDVDLLVKINKKRKLTSLINQMTHDNTCRFEDLLGTVRYVETALINRAHHIHNQIVRDKRMMTDGEVVDGALVLDPNAGLHQWLGSVDINSLYPSVIRSLNISPEMLIGQFISGNASNEIRTNGDHFINATPGELDWAGIMHGDDLTHVLMSDDGETFEATGKEWQFILKDRKWALTAFGTVFDQSKGLGIIPKALEAWYFERKKLQKESKIALEKYDELFKVGQAEESDGLVCREDKWFTPDQAKQLDAFMTEYEDKDLSQMSKKLTLNSTYGAMLSPYFGLGRKEMGASTTSCGRAITKHMIQTIGYTLTGEETKVTWYLGPKKRGADGKHYQPKATVCNNPRILLSDTDSAYFVTGADNKEEAVAIADETAKIVNDSFPKFMMKSFFVNEGHENLIKCGREIVGSAGLFLGAKKKYTIRVVDKEGRAVNQLKTMGSELKKVDTPKAVQDFLQEMVSLILDGENYDVLEKFVNKKRKSLVIRTENPLALGATKGINGLNDMQAAWIKAGKPLAGKIIVGGAEKALPGHVRAAIYYNEMAKHFEGAQAKLINGGDKARIFYLKPNEFGMKSMAIPVDFEQFPTWFIKNFQVDLKETEQKMIDNKIGGIFDALNWDVPTPQNANNRKSMIF